MAAPTNDGALTELRVEVGGPSAVAVVPVLCGFAKVKRQGACTRARAM
jgi:hypothetical protein